MCPRQKRRELTVIPLSELSTWLINAFNGEWLRTDDPVPISNDVVRERDSEDEDGLQFVKA